MEQHLFIMLFYLGDQHRTGSEVRENPSSFDMDPYSFSAPRQTTSLSQPSDN
jgi:hypothetical protein